MILFPAAGPHAAWRTVTLPRCGLYRVTAAGAAAAAGAHKLGSRPGGHSTRVEGFEISKQEAVTCVL